MTSYYIIPEKTMLGISAVSASGPKDLMQVPRCFLKTTSMDFREFVEKEFLPADSSALQFRLYRCCND